MNTYLLKLDTDKLDGTLPTTGEIAQIVLENNPRMKFVPAYEGALVAVQCGSQPRSIPGCKWVKVEE